MKRKGWLGAGEGGESKEGLEGSKQLWETYCVCVWGGEGRERGRWEGEGKRGREREGEGEGGREREGLKAYINFHVE